MKSNFFCPQELSFFRFPDARHTIERRLALLTAALLAGSSPGYGSDSYSPLFTFDGSNGKAPVALILVSNTLYGTTREGGTSNLGTVFKLNLDGSGFATLKSFAGPPNDGATPVTQLLYSEGTLYGYTRSGESSTGTVFKVDVDGNNYSVLKRFTGPPDDGRDPSGLVLSGNTLYGTTLSGGISNAGTLFQINADGTGYQVLKHFVGEAGSRIEPNTNDACNPLGTLVFENGAIYGSTLLGGPTGEGAVYKFQLSNGDFEVLQKGTYADGCHYISGLISSGTTLYGTCCSGGGGLGTVFKIGMDGTGYENLRAFTGFDGINPWRLILDGDTLYGSASQGGVTNLGVIFQVKTDKTHSATLKDFKGPEGSYPWGVVVSGHTLYGAAESGGAANAGLIFTMSLPTPLISRAPQSQTIEQHATAHFSAKLDGALPFYCLWQRDGASVGNWTTNCYLDVPDVQPSDGGSYTLVVTNDFGAVTSPAALLSVIEPVPRKIVPHLLFDGKVGSTIGIEYVDSFGSPAAWTLLDQLLLTSAPQSYFDLSTPLPAQRFYRSWQVSAVPSQSLSLVPALTVTGTPGSSVRIEYINQFGPVDAWTPLATVVMTNTSQLYFDVSAVGKPSRLWRLLPVP
jgi:uncharacterized repeat protein (TIGR03803 family)